MDSFEWNKIFGAVLGTGLLVFALKIVGGGLFATEAPEKPGFAIATAETGEGDKTADAGPAKSLGTLLAAADKDKGASAAKACGACHDFSKGGPAKVGPNLYDIVGRGIGSAAGFAYSDGFKAEAGKNWDYEALDKWLTKPATFIKGTKMAFAGIAKPEDRANVLAYLGSLSDAPKAFPAP
jgi:cytochrome c